MDTRGIAELAIEAYLDEVAARLIGPRPARAAIVAELRDGIHAATSAHRARGRGPDAAVAAALAEFGSAATVAHAFVDDLANAHARRVSAGYLLTGPIVGISWLLLLAPPNWSHRGPGALWSAIPALPCALLGVLTGLLVLASTGRLSRWIRPGPHHLLDATTLLGLACIVGDLVVLAVLAADSATVTEPGIPAAVAVCASITRLVCSLGILRRCRIARRALASS